MGDDFTLRRAKAFELALAYTGGSAGFDISETLALAARIDDFLLGKSADRPVDDLPF